MLYFGTFTPTPRSNRKMPFLAPCQRGGPQVRQGIGRCSTDVVSDDERKLLGGIGESPLAVPE